ncbi:MAG: LytTR family DNA-binding domain-containing protein [Eubacteriaceae bacterium]|nr:LytTR family DNA-binding domain-containing protein [Eubacteriaceae bacterium]
MAKCLCIRGKKETWKLNISDIVFVRQEGKEIQIFTEKNTIRKTGSIAELKEKLDDRFFTCHKYCLVNFDKVFGMRDSEIIFETGQSVTMGVNSYRNARKAFHMYMENGGGRRKT